MKKVLVFLFLILMGIFFSVAFSLIEPSSREKEEKTPPRLFAKEEVLVPFHTFHWKLPVLDLTVQKTDLKPHQQEREEKKKSVWNYISVGQCEANTLSPVYLGQKMQKGMADKKTLPVRNVDCGLIRTNIPFSF